MIDTVTITGADDGVDPSELLTLSAEFPFVEWGILFSIDRCANAEPRYPSGDWSRRLASSWKPGVRLSLHLCGKASRQTLAGDGHYIGHGVESALYLGDGPKPFHIFRRVQLNGYEAPYPRAFEALVESAKGLEFILQARGPGHFEEVGADARSLPRASVLFDPSGGRGLIATDIPVRVGGDRVGLAGGIGPENVEVTYRFAETHGYSWIDMESGVRTDNRFDLAKVRDVLERVARLRGAVGEVR